MALPYFPLEDGNFKLSMGLKPAPSGSWIKVDHDYEQQINIRRSLLQKQRSDVFASVKDASKAEHRVCQMVQETLKFQMPNLSSFKPLDDENDLVKAASLIQEDLVIMREGENGFNLISAVVCFPSAWNLKTKVGESIRNIHAPVPGVNKQIGHSIDLFFKNMKQEKLVERFNWGLYDREDLFQPDWWRSCKRLQKSQDKQLVPGFSFV
ncbi:heme-dependent oxidative N-demethylase subunit alpha family protein [Sneathiella glossodoripedis]|uniref:heme-dependent oxidative N-demethylase subunit alpha family protein n=1 Tax=Sneathiella glossodoripedis TaxID=418853 RepID=UPI000472A9F0|nr:heme-dependent oxidative N-demethylase subunit alpha family protein [Sneathiella glossodoripedis]